MKIVVGIDGTGSEFLPGSGRDASYDRAFANSFVTRLTRRAITGYAYWRGPVALGGGMVGAINGAYSFITGHARSNPGSDILLTGYSRGGAGVVSLANRLNSAGLTVKAMLLFDPVDRHLFIDAATIPSNVRNVLHLTRDPRAGSRESFDNDAMQYYPSSTTLSAFKYMCTHGGMGGTPWDTPSGKTDADKVVESFPDGDTNVTYKQDRDVSAQIWRDIQGFCQTQGYF